MNVNWSAIRTEFSTHWPTLAASSLIFMLGYVSISKHLRPAATSEMQLARYTQEAADLPRLQAAMRETGNEPMASAPSQNVTVADLQGRLGRMARDAGLTLSSSEAALPVDERGARPNVMIVVEGPLSALQRLIYQIEIGSFGWTIDMLEIQSDVSETARAGYGPLHASMRVSSP